MTYSHRRQKVADLLVKLDLDAMVFCKPENLRYLCNFSGSDGALVATPDRLVFLTDSRYTTQASTEVSAEMPSANIRSKLMGLSHSFRLPV
jgi:Xaa-Pro aminopeptidase